MNTRSGPGAFVSILAADGVAVDAPRAPACFADLYLDQVIDNLTFGQPDEALATLFYAPQHDPAVITYRHDVFRDLQRADVRAAIDRFVAGMRIMRERLNRSTTLWHPLQQQGWFIYAVQAYCEAVQILHDELAPLSVHSRGLCDFSAFLADYIADPAFETLVSQTRDVQARLHDVRYTVHIDGLRVHVDKYAGQDDYSAQVTAVFERFVTQEATDYRVALPDFPDMNHVEEQILECVAKLYPELFAELANFCARYADFAAPTIVRFDREIPFYLCYLVFMQRFTAANLAFSYPDVTDSPGIFDVTGAFDLALAPKLLDDAKTPVCNDFRLGGSERIFVITGPNQGGKTTSARTIGQCLYLAALGCPVPAASARISVPDQIYTHFERQETLVTLHGKLDDELVRIHEILSRATPRSAVVMNESFASTTASDALVIGAEVLTRITDLGCIAVYVTFLDELSRLNPACVSMVGEIDRNDPTQRTFRFTHRPADGLAYAAALARKYGLSHDVLLRRITE